MGLMSSKVEREKLRPGDHIYTWRSGYSYSHHGIYVGDGKVVHLTRGPGYVISSSSRSQPSNDDHVECCNIQDFLYDGQLYRFEYGVNKILFVIKRAGTCLPVSSNPPEQVLRRANYLLDNGFGNYDLLKKNCEDFAIYCKTGILGVLGWGSRGISGQIRSLFTALAAIIICPYRFQHATLIGQALLMVCGLYYFIRLCDAFGFDSESDVVAVEELDHINNKRYERKNMYTKMTGTRWFLPGRDYIDFSIMAIRIWYWTPESKIGVWFKTIVLYGLLTDFVANHLRLHCFKLGENSAYTIYVLGYLYWRWTSESTLLLWTRLIFLSSFLFSISDGAGRLRIKINKTTTVLAILHWTPRITILKWIKLVWLYNEIFVTYFYSRLANHRLMLRRSIFACFLIQSAAIFLGLDYIDYIYRIRKIIFL